MTTIFCNYNDRETLALDVRYQGHLNASYCFVFVRETCKRCFGLNYIPLLSVCGSGTINVNEHFLGSLFCFFLQVNGGGQKPYPS